MYEYEKKTNSLASLGLPVNVDIKLDVTPVQHPYVARICANQGYFLIWYASPGKWPEITPVARKAKIEETQSISLNNPNKIEYAQALIYPYDDEVIIGTVKYYNYMRVLGNNATNKILKNVWKDIITMFGDRKIICPSGSYFQLLHFVMNQKKIPRSAYKENLMKSLRFKRNGDYWIRDANLLD